MKHFNIRITGRVQGVYFRASTKEQAEKLGINGFVRNERDNSVYLEAEGEEHSLNKLVQWCKSGPEMAKVSDVEVSEGKVVGMDSFEVKL